VLEGLPGVDPVLRGAVLRGSALRGEDEPPGLVTGDAGRLVLIPEPDMPPVPYELPAPAVVPPVRQAPDMLLPPVPRVPIMRCRPYESLDVGVPR
jgi:hypothetical protein